jgi:hypothetical protein
VNLQAFQLVNRAGVAHFTQKTQHSKQELLDPMPDLTARESFNRLLTIELALTDAHDWVSSLHPTSSRVMRRQRYAAALEMLRTEITTAAERLCDCAQRERTTGIADGEARHLSTCPAWRVNAAPPAPAVSK